MIQMIRRRVRKRRACIFRSYVPHQRPLKVIDIGGTVAFWKAWGITESDQIQVTLINNHHIDVSSSGTESDLPFIINELSDANQIQVDRLKKFDLIFSNSFLEHLESRAQQAAMAEKIISSGVRYFIQIPNKRSIIDPHFPRPWVPFFACYPKPVQARLLTLGACGSGARSSTLEQARERIRYYNPLSVADMRRLFPDAVIRIERTVGIPLSVLVMSEETSHA